MLSWQRAGWLLLAVLIVLQLLPYSFAVEGNDKRDQWLTPGHVSFHDAARALNFAPDEGELSLEIAAAEEADGSHLLNVASGGIENPATFLSVGRLTSITQVTGIGLTVPQREPERNGYFRDGSRWRPWALHRSAGTIQALVALPDGAGVAVVDSRLLPATPELSAVIPALQPSGRTLTEPIQEPLSAGLVEAAILFWFILLGGLIIPLSWARGWSRLAAGLLSGLAVQATVGAFGRGIWALGFPAIFTAIVATVYWRRGAGLGWRRLDVLRLIGAFLVLLAATISTRLLGMAFITSDSLDYLSRAALQAQGSGTFIPFAAQSPGYSAIHAVGFLAGTGGLYALGLVVTLAAFGLIAASLREAHRTTRNWLWASLLMAVVVTSEQLRVFGLMVNSHALVAALLVLVGFLNITVQSRSAVGQEVEDPSEHSPGRVALAVIAGAIVLSRPEGVTLIALLLLGTVGSRQADRWQWAWLGGGFAAIADGAPALASFARGEVGAASIPDAVILLAGVTLIAAPTLVSLLKQSVRQLLPPIILSLAWILLLGLSLDDIGVISQLLQNTRENLFIGRGGWGATAISLVLISVIGLAGASREAGAHSRERFAPIVTLVIGFFPLSAFVRAYGSGTPGRIHWHDSINRMWVHVVLALVLLAALHGSDPAETMQPRSSWRRLVAALIPVAAIFSAFLWQPTFQREITDQSVKLVDNSVQAAAADIAESLELREGQPIFATLNVEPEREVQASNPESLRVCVDVPVATLEGTAAGTVRVDISGVDGFRSERSVKDLADVIPESFCSDLPPPLPTVSEFVAATGGRLEVRLEGTQGGGGIAPQVLVDDYGFPALSVSATWQDRSTWDELLLRFGPRVIMLITAFMLLAKMAVLNDQARQ